MTGYGSNDVRRQGSDPEPEYAGIEVFVECQKEDGLDTFTLRDVQKLAERLRLSFAAVRDRLIKVGLTPILRKHAA